jgi:hypothetical protein
MTVMDGPAGVTWRDDGTSLASIQFCAGVPGNPLASGAAAPGAAAAGAAGSACCTVDVDVAVAVGSCAQSCGAAAERGFHAGADTF